MFTDTGRKAEVSVSAVTANTLVHTGSVVGNLVVVVTCTLRLGTDVSDPVVTDDKGNTWTRETTQWITATGIGIGFSWCIVAAAKDGNLTISSSPNGVNTFAITYYSHEFTGPHATPKSGTQVLNTGTSTTADTTTMTPADNDPLVIGATVAEASTTWTENVAPGETDWTLSNDEESAATGAPSSFVYKIVSGAPGTPRSAWTLGTSRVWATNIIAFKPSAGGPSAGTDTATAGLTDTMRTVSVSLSIAESG